MSMNARAADLLSVMSRLIEVLEREIALLRTMKPAEMQDLQRDKIVLAAAYESKVKELGARAGEAEGLEPELSRALAKAAAAFQETLAHNEQALRSAKETTDRVLQAVVREVESARARKGSYTASGKVQGDAGGERPISVAVDQRL